jgi:hypothetical protein
MNAMLKVKIPSARLQQFVTPDSRKAHLPTRPWMPIEHTKLMINNLLECKGTHQHIRKGIGRQLFHYRRSSCYPRDIRRKQPQPCLPYTYSHSQLELEPAEVVEGRRSSCCWILECDVNFLCDEQWVGEVKRERERKEEIEIFISRAFSSSSIGNYLG